LAQTVGSAFPEFLKLWKDGSDKKHEITLLKMQMEQQAQGHKERLEEININADVSESQALYKTYTTGINWVDALNGTVRPVIAYSFFFLYAGVKILQYSADLPWLLWTEEDQAIFAGICPFSCFPVLIDSFLGVGGDHLARGSTGQQAAEDEILAAITEWLLVVPQPHILAGFEQFPRDDGRIAVRVKHALDFHLAIIELPHHQAVYGRLVKCVAFFGAKPPGFSFLGDFG
jgi:hypothetical protein